MARKNQAGHGCRTRINLNQPASTISGAVQHWLDDTAGIAMRGMKSNEMYFEARAFLSEQQFANAIGRPEISTLGRLTQQFGSRDAAWQFIKGQYGYGQ